MQAEVALNGKHGMLYIFHFLLCEFPFCRSQKCKQEVNCNQLCVETTEVKSDWYLFLKLCIILFSAHVPFLFALERSPNSHGEYLSFNPCLDIEFVNRPFWLLLVDTISASALSVFPRP